MKVFHLYHDIRNTVHKEKVRKGSSQWVVVVQAVELKKVFYSKLTFIGIIFTYVVSDNTW